MRWLFMLCLICFVAPMALAAEVLEVILPDGQARAFSREDLAALPQVEIARPGGDAAAARVYGGPSLDSLLAKAGVAIGDKMKGEELRYVVTATGADGFSAVLSLAEVESSIAEGKVLVALTRDRAPLAEGEGPLRLIVEKDRRPVRAVKNLVKIAVAKAGSAPK